jgi:shikimate kinase
MKSSISLIGMAGAGKSSVGKELANALNFRLIDSDTLIES